MTPVEAKKILQSAMMNEYQLTEVDYASLINAIIEMQKENAELKAKLENAKIILVKEESLKHKNPEEYGVWIGIKKRCSNPKEIAYKDYGGRGIVVCDRWRISFSNFLMDMGNRPSSKHTIERINNDGNYEPTNCKWVTRSENNRNTRRNSYLTHNGKTLTIVEWAEITGINADSISARKANGWSDRAALETPLRKGNYRPKVPQTFTVKGETKTLKEWLNPKGLSVGAFYYRRRLGMSIEDAINRPSRNYSPLVKKQKQV